MGSNTASLSVSNVDWLDSETDPDKPRLTISQDDSAAVRSNRIVTDEGDPLEASEIDVAVRLRDSLEATNPTGVVAITNRITGEYVLECETGADSLLTFVRAARTYEDLEGDSAGYELVVEVGDETLATYEKRTFLVYGESGELLRNRSLIPSGIEI